MIGGLLIVLAGSGLVWWVLWRDERKEGDGYVSEETRRRLKRERGPY